MTKKATIVLLLIATLLLAAVAVGANPSSAQSGPAHVIVTAPNDALGVFHGVHLNLNWPQKLDRWCLVLG